MDKELFHKELQSYIEKIFFFCIKRCNNRFDAEDLSQTILLEILISFNKGIKINNLDYYVWAIAHNQYSKYQKSKIVCRSQEVNVDCDTIDYYAADNKSILSELISNEQFEVIVMQIKLLSEDFAHIVYGYYIEDKTIKAIAQEYNLPLGTVKYKLFELRKKFKEDNMERLPGKKAFAPKRFASSMCGTGNPHLLAGPLINKNILFHSYDNPCTLEDYALELGISIPYINDAVETLYNGTLLKKTDDNKYITNFAILSKEFDIKLHQFFIDNSNSYLEALKRYCIKYFEDYKDLAKVNIDDQLLMWSLMFEVNSIMEDLAIQKFEYSHKYRYGNFDFHMTEMIDNQVNFWTFSENYQDSSLFEIAYKTWPAGSWYNGHVDPKNCLLYNRCSNGTEAYQLFAKIRKNPDMKYSDYDNEIQDCINQNVSLNYLEIKDDKVLFRFPYLTKEDVIELRQMVNNEDAKKVLNELRILYNNLKITIENYLPMSLNNQVNYLAYSLICDIRGFAVDAFLEAGLVKSTYKEPFTKGMKFDNSDKFIYNMIVWDR